MASDAKAALDMLKQRRSEIRDGVPEVAKGFFTSLQAAESDGALSHKTKELMTLGISIAIRCNFCIAAHLQACLKAGATREEIMEVLGVAIAMGGGPSYTYSAYVLEMLEELEGESE
jgi:AhpD family alkylhydroperoxidase